MKYMKNFLYFFAVFVLLVPAIAIAFAQETNENPIKNQIDVMSIFESPEELINQISSDFF